MAFGDAAAAPYLGMITMQLAQAGLMVAGKVAMANGMTPFTFAFYSNAFASILLLPVSFFMYRSVRPPLLSTFMCGFFLLGSLGFLAQILGYAGIMYSSASLSTSMLNLIPGFTFVFAVLFRLERFEFRSLTTLAKSMGTAVSIVGALVITLYRGPSILGKHSDGSFLTLSPSSAWLLGGLLLAIDCVMSSIFIIAQALVLKKCPAELILVCFYSWFVAILSAAASLVMGNDISAWSLNNKMKLIPIVYSALFGHVFQVSIIMWCVKRKGPLFAALFHPLGVIFGIAMSFIILGESLYMGSLVGSIVVVCGFYLVMWGKAKEAKVVEEKKIVKSLETDANGTTTAPLLGP